MPVVFLLVAACQTDRTVRARSGEPGEVVIPLQSEWTDRGVVIAPGAPGAWDARLTGAISPSTLVKKDGTYFLYYIGASGDRRLVADGGPANRRLGVATSTDGIEFTKYEGNPILTHAHGVPNCDECGIFSAAAFVGDDGLIVLYYGGMEEYRPGSVDGDIVLATSTDGLEFMEHGDLWTHRQSGTTVGNEIFPIGAFEDDGRYHVYFLEPSGAWNLWLLEGPAHDAMESDRRILASPQVAGGGDVTRLSETRILVPLFVSFADRLQQMRTTTLDALDGLGAPERLYDFDVGHFVMYLDREARTWFFYWNDPDTGIRVKTAPLRFW